MPEVDAHDLVRAADPTRGRDATPKVRAGHAARFLETVTGDPSFLPTVPDPPIAQLDRPIPEQVAAQSQAIRPPDVTLRVKRQQRDMAKLDHVSILPDTVKISSRYVKDAIFLDAR